MGIWDALTAWSGTTMDREYFEFSLNGLYYGPYIAFVIGTV